MGASTTTGISFDPYASEINSDVDPFATLEPLTDVVVAATATVANRTDDAAVVRLYSVTDGSNNGDSVSPITDKVASVESDSLNALIARKELSAVLLLS